MKTLNCTRFVVVLSAMIGMSSLLHGSASALAGMAIVQSPTQLTWGPAPPQLPKGVQLAVLAGDPAKAGLYTIRTLSVSNGRLAVRLVRTGIRLMST